MNLRWWMLLLLAVVYADTAAAKAAQPKAATSQMDSIGWLNGDWTSQVKSIGNGKPAPEVVSHFRSMLGGRVMSISMTADGNEFMQGMFAYDGAKKAIAFWYVVSGRSEEDDADGGTLAAGTIKSEQGSLVMDFTGTRLTGEVGHFQTRIERIGTRSYCWRVYADYPGEGLQKLNDIVFTRKR